MTTDHDCAGMGRGPQRTPSEIVSDAAFSSWGARIHGRGNLDPMAPYFAV